MLQTAHLTPIGIIVGALALAGFVIKHGKDDSSKHNRIYERLDEDRDDVDSKYVRKDICQLQHTNVEKKLDEVSRDVKKLLTKNGIK